MITSTGNSRVKQIRGLRSRKERSRSGLFFIEGLRIVGEAIQLGAEIETLVVAPELLTSQFGQSLVQTAAERGIPQLEVSARVFESLSGKEGPQGIAAVVWQRSASLSSVRVGDRQICVALDSVQDPGNLGAILRTCDAVGVPWLILLDHSTDPYDPAAVRASMGAIFSVNIAQATFEEFIAWAGRQGYRVVGTSGQGAHDYREVAYRAPMVLLMGSERLGLSAEQQAICDLVVRIPMVGRSDSLNLAVATGVVLYEIFHQLQHHEDSL